MTIGDYVKTDNEVSKFYELCKKYSLDVNVEVVKSYHSASTVFQVSNKNGMFFHTIETIEEMKSFHNAFALGMEYERLKEDNVVDHYSFKIQTFATYEDIYSWTPDYSVQFDFAFFEDTQMYCDLRALFGKDGDGFLGFGGTGKFSKTIEGLKEDK